jgi:hypothetical protein
LGGSINLLWNDNNKYWQGFHILGFMADNFQIPVTYRDTELLIPARLLQYGYTLRIEVEINGEKVFFERDEERNWRALMPYSENNKGIFPDPELLQKIATSIEDITR